MSVYEQTNIYPKLPSAPKQDTDSQSYRLGKIDQIECFLRDEASYRDKLVKRCKRRATGLAISHNLILSAIATLEVGSVISLTTVIGTPVSIALTGAGLFLGLGSVVTNKSQKIMMSKIKKHDKIKTLAEAKLDTISGLVSKAVEDTEISDQEYQFILKEVENYRKLKEQIRTKSKSVINQISTEQRETLLAQGREQGKADFLAKIAATSGIQTANAI